jgi:WD40 repeat protein
VTASEDNTARIWEASSGRCVQTLETGRVLCHISFDADSEVLRTDIGPLYFDVLSGSELAAVTPAADNAYNQILGLSGDHRWITVALEKVVWLPSEYRPSCSVVSGKVMGVGVGSGRVWMCRLSI